MHRHQIHIGSIIHSRRQTNKYHRPTSNLDKEEKVNYLTNNCSCLLRRKFRFLLQLQTSQYVKAKYREQRELMKC